MTEKRNIGQWFIDGLSPPAVVCGLFIAGGIAIQIALGLQNGKDVADSNSKLADRVDKIVSDQNATNLTVALDHSHLSDVAARVGDVYVKYGALRDRVDGINNANGLQDQRLTSVEQYLNLLKNSNQDSAPLRLPRGGK